MAFISTWSEEMVAELRRLWTAGDSCAVIGRAMGLSRNAVIGKAHRLKLEKRAERINPNPAIRRVKVFERKELRPKPSRPAGERHDLGPNFGFSPRFVRKSQPAPEMTKTQMRQFLAQAVMNTGRAPEDAA